MFDYMTCPNCGAELSGMNEVYLTEFGVPIGCENCMRTVPAYELIEEDNYWEDFGNDPV